MCSNSTVSNGLLCDKNGPITLVNENLEDQKLWLYFQLISYILIFIIGIVGNAFVIIVIITNKKLKTVTNVHTNTNIYLLNLAIADFIYLFSTPFAIITLIKESWTFSKVICSFYWIISSINFNQSAYLVVLLSFDR